MQKRFRNLLVALLALVVFSYGQEIPKIQGFDAGFVTYGPMAAGFRSFEVRVDFDPWHFVAKGQVNAGPVTEDLDIMPEAVGVGLFHYDGDFKDAKGNAQKAGMVDIVFVVDDERAKVKDLIFELLPPANSNEAKSALAAAQQKYQAYMVKDLGSRIGAEEPLLTTALSDPWNKKAKATEQKAMQAKIEKAKQDSVAKEQAALVAKEQAKRDSIALVQARTKAKQDSIAQAKLDAQTAKEAKALAAKEAAEAKKKKKVAPVVEEKPEPVVAADEKPAPKKKKKKKTVVEDEEEQVEAAVADEDEESVPVKKKKKKKKKKTVAEESEAGIGESSAPADEEGVPGAKEKRKKIGIGFAVAGGVAAIYGLYQQSVVNEKLGKLKDLEALGITADNLTKQPSFDNKSYHDIEAEKKGAETQRTLGIVLGAFCIAGSVVLLKF